MSFAQVDYAGKKKQQRRDNFLNPVEQVALISFDARPADTGAITSSSALVRPPT
jgi:hypothetical protein